MSVADGLAEPCPDLGPVIDENRVAAVTSAVDEVLAGGARRLTRVRELPADGCFGAPTLLEAVPEGSDLVTQEVFGPVAGVFGFHDEHEALALLNRTDMGLAGYVWTREAARCWRLAERLEVGILGINDPLSSVVFAPMGGVKRSGLGGEGASAGLEEFQDVRYLAWRGK